MGGVRSNSGRFRSAERGSIEEQINELRPGGGKLPAALAFGDQFAAGFAALLLFVDGEEFHLRAFADLGFGAGNEEKWQSVEVERDFVSGNTFAVDGGIATNERGVVAEPGKFRIANEDATKFGTIADKIEKAEFCAESFLGEKEGTRIDADKIAAVPIAVIVAVTFHFGGVPGGVAIVQADSDLKMKMGPIFSDSLSSVGGATHDGDFLTLVDLIADAEPFRKCAQMGVCSINQDAFDAMLENNLHAVVG